MKSYLDLNGLERYTENLKKLIDSKTVVDTELSITSTRPVQNKVVTDRINKLIWTGTTSEYTIALATGEIVEGTIVNLTDDELDTALSPISNNEISALFA